MSAKDHLHNTVVRALQNDGWIIHKEQFFVNFPGRRLWIDIQAGNDSETILVEVKGFENIPSPVEYLSCVIGKYVLYRAALEKLGIATALYLAVPQEAYNSILSEALGQLLIQKANIALIVFEQEEIVEWIT